MRVSSIVLVFAVLVGGSVALSAGARSMILNVEAATPGPQAAAPPAQTASPKPQATTPPALTASPVPQTASPQAKTASPTPKTATPAGQTATPDGDQTLRPAHHEARRHTIRVRGWIEASCFRSKHDDETIHLGCPGDGRREHQPGRLNFQLF